MEIQDLILALKSGSQSGYSALYDQFGSNLYGVILRIVKEEAEAEHLLQDTFVKVWKHIEQYDSEKGSFFTWLLNIARNIAIDYTRSKSYKQSSKNQNLDNYVNTEYSGLGMSELNPEVIGLKRIVGNLQQSHKEIIEWLYFDGFTQQEIASTFGIPLGTVKTRTRAALKELRLIFENKS